MRFAETAMAEAVAPAATPPWVPAGGVLPKFRFRSGDCGNKGTTGVAPFVGDMGVSTAATVGTAAATALAGVPATTFALSLFWLFTLVPFLL